MEAGTGGGTGGGGHVLRPRPSSTPNPVLDLDQFIIDDEDGDVQVHAAAYAGNLIKLRQLLQARPCGQDINRRVRPFGATPLRLAATNNHVECIKCLLSHEAQVDLPDFKAQTPLMVAVQHQHLECARLLLEAGARPDGDPENRCSMLYVAAKDGFLEGIKLLLRFGANPELEDRLVGMVPGSPLHTAAVYQHFECFAALLLGGAQADLRLVRPPLPCHVIRLLSLSHTLVRHRCPLRFGQLFVQFGGSLWQVDKNGLLASEMPQDCPCKTFFQQKLGEPLSLRSLCRLRIRHHLGHHRLKCIPSLPIPKMLRDYLHYTPELGDVDNLLSYTC